MTDRYRIIYNSEKEDAFIVHLPDKLVRFERIWMNLYVFKPPTTIKAENSQMLNTVEENKTFYTERQFERSKQARDLFHALAVMLKSAILMPEKFDVPLNKNDLTNDLEPKNYLEAGEFQAK